MMNDLAFKLVMLACCAEAMQMEGNPAVLSIREFFAANTQYEAKMDARLPSDGDFQAWVEQEAEILLAKLKADKDKA